jgi:hypothetical protein
MIPEQYKMVITGDREFAGKDFIRNILRIKDTEAVIRIKKNTDVTDTDGNPIRLGDRKKSLSGCFYGKNTGMIYIDNNDEDKVIVFSGIRNTGLVKRFYEKRMGIEEMFRDMKTGFGLKKIGTENRIRFKNLTVFSLIAYLTAVIAHGTLGEKSEYFSYFQTVIHRMIIGPLLIRQFSFPKLSETGKL